MDIKITQKEMGKCLLFGGETRRALDPCSLKVLFILSDKVMKHGRCFYIENGQHRGILVASPLSPFAIDDFLEPSALTRDDSQHSEDGSPSGPW